MLKCQSNSNSLMYFLKIVSLFISFNCKPKCEDLLKTSLRDPGKSHLPGRCSPGAKNAGGAWKLLLCLEAILADKCR